MKLEAGMYVRTDDGRIAKIIEILSKEKVEDGKIVLRFEIDREYQRDEGYNASYTLYEDWVIKASYNIIDLIKAGDYVNNCYIREIMSLKNNVMKCLLDTDCICVSTIRNSDIKSVVTKDQFEALEYLVGGEENDS